MAAAKFRDLKEYNAHLKILFNSNTIAKEFKGTRTKVLHKCKKHNLFYETTPANVERSKYASCPRCSREGISISKTRTTVEYQKILDEKFKGNIRIVGEYKGGRTWNTHSCAIHGKFKQKPDYIVQGCVIWACQKCAGDAISKSSTITHEEYLNKLSAMGASVMPLEQCQGAYVEILHKCTKHNLEFRKTPYSIYGAKNLGCPKCVSHAKRHNQPRLKSTKTYLDELYAIHGENIKLVSPRYKGALKQHMFQCTRCSHKWETIASSLVRPLKYSSCPVCSSKQVSKPEIALYKWVKKFFPDAVQSYRKVYSDCFERNFEIDIFIPSKNFGIEFNGLYYHSYPNKPKWYHYEKTKCCQRDGIKLVHIYEDDW
jgi:DNA-directed RNA polymerase subunit RPC12/RpoP